MPVKTMTMPDSKITTGSLPRTGAFDISSSDPLPPSPYPQDPEPSPIESTGTSGTKTTDIDDDSQEEEQDQDIVSTIHKVASVSQKDLESKRQTTPSPSAYTLVSPKSPCSNNKRKSMTSPLNTDIPPSRGERPTPRAQTREDVEEELELQGRRRTNLAGIPERFNRREADQVAMPVTGNDLPRLVDLPDLLHKQIMSLQSALTECWQLCNRLEGLSLTHRTRIFSYRGRPAAQEQAFTSAWSLCEHLYNFREARTGEQTLETLDLFRSFCQALFEVRQKQAETSDSVLRVSFEFNNHLHTGLDRSLGTAYYNRALQFYYTICYRLMRLGTSLPEETNDLLRACWALIEALFQLRTDRRDEEISNEEYCELWANAVQACWDLCDLFREGWTQVRPDRGTPRPAASITVGSPPSQSQSQFGTISFPEPSPFIPPTPTTIIEDINDENLEERHDPQILVLGPAPSSSRGGSRASRPPLPPSSNAYSSSNSQTASSTTNHTSASSLHDANLSRLRFLLLKAAFNRGFKQVSSSTTSPTAADQASFQTFVAGLPVTAFGTHAAHLTLLKRYKRLVAGWPAFCRRVGGTGATNDLLIGGQVGTRRAVGLELARGVQGVVGRVGEGWSWLEDLFWAVVGCRIGDEAACQGIEVVI